MMWFQIIVCLFVSAEGSNVLTLNQYLETVKKQSPQARALIAQIDASEVKVKKATLGLSPEFFAEYNRYDDRTPPVFPFSPSRRDGHSWKAGIEKQTTLGLGGKLYFENNSTTLFGINPSFLPVPNYNQGRAVLELKQSLWRNSFGEKTRSDLEADIAASKAALEDQKFQLQKLLLQAENTYWSMVTYDQIVSLQEENAERAKKLSEWMGKQGRLKLIDDVDVLQSKTAYDMRALDLETSRQERNSMARVFNSLRGVDAETVEKLEALPPFKASALADLNRKVTRQDFKSFKSAARAQEMAAKSIRSTLKPEVDLVGTVASNGLDPRFSGMFNEVKGNDFPSWSVGLQVRFPLNVSLTHRLKAASLNDIRAAQDQAAGADLQLQTEWHDTVQKSKDYYDLYMRSKEIESSYGTIVQKERKRLQNGRSTTFTLLNLEQTLVSTQIQRTKAQLALIQIQNVLKTFEVANESI